jgi:arylsulfatase A-like enzyme
MKAVEMNPCFLILILLLGASPMLGAKGPNILLVMADDLGYSDLGCYGGEIDTPNLDCLAANGLRYTQFTNTARCWPTRAALLTGYYAQQVRRDNLPGIKRGSRPDWAPLLPVFLKERGYRCYHSGKWHIDGKPVAQGFDRSYSISNHGFFRLKDIMLDDKTLPFEGGEGWYATTSKADYAIQFLQEHAKTHPEKPFFQYLAFTAPHFPLHAKPEDITLFRDRYQEGWDIVRFNRWKRQAGMGITELKFKLPPFEPKVGPPYHFENAYKILGEGEVRFPVPWDALTASQQAFQAEKMAIHAAMVYRLDLELGRVINQIKKMGQWEDTVVMFLSDNGASAEIMVRGDGHDPNQPMGSAFTYLCLGPGWSTACNTPFRRHKTWVHGGGCNTPLIVHWPAGIEARGEIRQTPGHVVDIVPTILELTSAKRPALAHAPLPPGESLVGSFSSGRCNREAPIWYSHEGNRAIRSGDWKLVAAKGDPWELYNLGEDRNESTDLSSEHPDTVKELARVWQDMETQFASELKK